MKQYLHTSSYSKLRLTNTHYEKEHKQPFEYRRNKSPFPCIWYQFFFELVYRTGHHLRWPYFGSINDYLLQSFSMQLWWLTVSNKTIRDKSFRSIRRLLIPHTPLKQYKNTKTLNHSLRLLWKPRKTHCIDPHIHGAVSYGLEGHHLLHIGFSS